MCIFLYCCTLLSVFVVFKQKTEYEMRISDWSSDVCSSDLLGQPLRDARDDADAGRQHVTFFGPDIGAGAISISDTVKYAACVLANPYGRDTRVEDRKSVV